jgi:hypothetical protein
MKTRLLAAALIALALVGCSIPTPTDRTAMDIFANAVVRVVNNRIEVSPDPILVTRPGVAKITWTLDASAVAAGFRFAAVGRGIRVERGVQIDRNVPGGSPKAVDAGSEFEQPNSLGTQYTVVFRNSRPGRHEYKYSITLEGPSTLTLDPAIVNDW